jgi:hypothetical protein
VSHESARSRKYTAGLAVRYSGRIRGPTFPVKTFSVDDLPDDSQLRSAKIDGAMAAWFAASGISHKGSGPRRDDLYTTLHSTTHLGHGKSDG